MAANKYSDKNLEWQNFRCASCNKLIFKALVVKDSEHRNGSKVGVESKCPRCHFMNYNIYLV